MFNGTLRPFQEEVAEFMLDMDRPLGGKTLVAADLGLGKTVITLAVVEELFEDRKVNAGLVVALSPLKYQWHEKVQEFTDAKSIVIDGTPIQRERQYHRALSGRFTYIIMNYEQVLNDWEFVRELPHDFIVADECTYIKSFAAKRTKAMKRLDADFMYGLTGQPVENKPEEAFSLVEWMDKEHYVLKHPELFEKTFIVRRQNRVVRYKNLDLFHNRMTRIMFRVNRAEVADQLPKVIDENVYVDFDAKTADLYRRVVSDLLNDIYTFMAYGKSFDVFSYYSGSGGKDNMELAGKVMGKLTVLRMLCTNPLLLKISSKLREQSDRDGVAGGSKYAYELDGKGILDWIGEKPGPKMVALKEHLSTVLSEHEKNKVVLFSFYKDNLKFIQQMMPYGSVQFHGGMNAKTKENNKKKFQTDTQTRLFISSDAGGYGLDLPQANYGTNFDLPWSVGKLDQRNGRIIRLSSEFDSVTLTNILMQGSIEVWQYEILKMKKRIASAIVDGTGADSKGKIEVDLLTLTKFLEASTV